MQVTEITIPAYSNEAEDGVASFRGFYGTYEVEIEIGQNVYFDKLTLTSKGSSIFNVQIKK